jgi:small subunit ribosomal protein S15e
MVFTLLWNIQRSKKKRNFRKYTYRGMDFDALLGLAPKELAQQVTCRIRRRFNRGLKRKPAALMKKIRKAVS